MFQSSPDPKAGRYTKNKKIPLFIFFVPILTRPEGRALPGNSGAILRAKHVPILTRPEGRALRDGFYLALYWSMFQSSPDPKAGRYGPLGDVREMIFKFQSSPDPKAGRYL